MPTTYASLEDFAPTDESPRCYGWQGRIGYLLVGGSSYNVGNTDITVLVDDHHRTRRYTGTDGSGPPVAAVPAGNAPPVAKAIVVSPVIRLTP